MRRSEPKNVRAPSRESAAIPSERAKAFERFVWWELARAWRLYDAAVREGRLEETLRLAGELALAEGRARALLDMAPRAP